MKRVKPLEEQPTPIKRVKAIIPATPLQPAPKRVKAVAVSAPPTRIKPQEPQGTPEPQKNERGVWQESPGNYQKTVMCDGEIVVWPCSPSGFLKDYRTATHVSHYGRLFRLLSNEEERECDVAIAKKMEDCFPHSSYRRGKIMVTRPWIEKEKARLLRENADG